MLACGGQHIPTAMLRCVVLGVAVCDCLQLSLTLYHGKQSLRKAWQKAWPSSAGAPPGSQGCKADKCGQWNKGSDRSGCSEEGWSGKTAGKGWMKGGGGVFGWVAEGDHSDAHYLKRARLLERQLPCSSLLCGLQTMGRRTRRSRALGDAVTEQGEEGFAGGWRGVGSEDAGDSWDGGAEAVGPAGKVASGAGLLALGLQARAGRSREGSVDVAGTLAGDAKAFASHCSCLSSAHARSAKAG